MPFSLQRIIPLALFSIGLAGCSSGPRLFSAENTVAMAASPLNACSSWKYELNAHLSFISVSNNGDHILVSSSAEKRRKHHNDAEARLRLLNANGRVLWTRPLDQPAKAQDISSDGKIIAVNTYEGLFKVYNDKGKLLWEREHYGRPAVLSKHQRVLVLNDDDSEPKTAFVVYDYAGNQKQVVRTDAEPFDMTVADDETFVAVTTTDHNILAYQLDGTLLWTGEMQGASVGISAHGGTRPRIFALVQPIRQKSKQVLVAFAPQGKILKQIWQVSLENRYEAIRADSSSIEPQNIFLYGNSKLGQTLAAHQSTTGAELWNHAYSLPSNYSSTVYTSSKPEPLFIVALDSGQQPGTLHIMGVRSVAGDALWNTAISASDGLYSYAFAEGASTLFVGAGDPGHGTVEALTISSHPHCR